MGAMEVIQGVSASTIALILGVYQEFIHSLRSIDRNAFVLLGSKDFEKFWTKINGNFLVTLLLGILTGLILLTQVVSRLFHSQFIIISSFLFGIILISGLLLLRKVTRWKLRAILFLFLGVAINYAFGSLEPIDTPNGYLPSLLAGFFAGFSFTFPGVSSAFILILIGKYQFIVTSFSALNFGTIAIFTIGSLSGLWVASRFMYRILASYYSITIALLAGLMIGALNKLWPWRYIQEYVTNSKGEQVPAYDQSILPWHYTTLTGKDPQVFQAILMMALGVFIVVLIEKIAAGLKTRI
ncbi:MAG TPA: DUF368 domain-containing protein [Flavisolibacter sp.]|nr:DUF368 domain-containing protein [Flavisolibacter sp.]